MICPGCAIVRSIRDYSKIDKVKHGILPKRSFSFICSYLTRKWKSWLANVSLQTQKGTNCTYHLQNAALFHKEVCPKSRASKRQLKLDNWSTVSSFAQTMRWNIISGWRFKKITHSDGPYLQVLSVLLKMSGNLLAVFR